MNIIRKIALGLGKTLAKSAGVDIGRGWFPLYGGGGGGGSWQLFGWSKGNETFSSKADQINQLRSWVYICVNLISNEIASTPRKLYRRKGGKREEWEEVEIPGDLARVLNKPYEPFGTETNLFKFMSQSLDLCGEAPVFIDTAGGAGRLLKGLVPIPPHLLVPDVGSDGMRGWKVTSQGGKPLPLDKVCMALYPRPDDIYRGMSPVEALAAGVDLNTEIRRYSASLIKNYGVPGVIMVPDQPLNAQQREEMKEWAKNNKGKVGDERLYPYGIKVVAQGVAPRELDFINGHRITKEEILAGYGIPEILISGKDANRATLENATVNWLNTCIFPRLDIIEAAFNQQVVQRFYGAELWYGFERRTVEFGDDVARRESLSLQYNMVTVEEWREAHGLPRERPAGTDPNPRPAPLLPPEPPEEPEGPEPEEPLAKAVKKALKVFDRDLEWKAFDDAVRLNERPFAADMKRYFNSLKEQVIARLEAADREGRQPTAEELIDRNAEVKRLAGRIEPFVANSAEAGYNRGSRQAGARDQRWEETMARQSFLKTWARNTAGLVTDTTIKAVADALKPREAKADIAPPVWTLTEIVAELNGLFAGWGDTRAFTIAETETVGSMNWGTLEGYRDAPGVEMKEWLSQQDEKVREEPYNHRLDGTQIALTARFPTGGSGLLYPGDPSGAPGDIINCRCTQLPVLEE